MSQIEGFSAVVISKDGSRTEGFAILSSGRERISLHDNVGIMAERYFEKYAGVSTEEDISFPRKPSEVNCEESSLRVLLTPMNQGDVKDFKADIADMIYGINQSAS